MANPSEHTRTRSVATDFISYHLENQTHYRWENGRDENIKIQPTQVQLAMRQVGDKFEEKYTTRFQSTVQQLRNTRITESDAYDIFMVLIQEIFDDGVNWGRIVVFFCIAAKFSVLCVEKQMPNMIDNVVDWVTAYVDNDLSDWMSRNNGWEGFLSFRDGGDTRRESTWPNMRTIGGYALAGLGVITLGAFLTQRS